MDLNKNTYVFFFSTAMVLVVAALLSFTSIKLKPLQQKNIALENKQNILSSVGIYVSREEADLNYEKYITDSFVLDSDGQKTDIDITSVQLNKETKKPKKEQNMPLYISNIDGSEKYIIPLRGTAMLKERLDKYLPYFENKMKENEVNDIMNFIEEDINLNDTINKLN